MDEQVVEVDRRRLSEPFLIRGIHATDDRARRGRHRLGSRRLSGPTMSFLARLIAASTRSGVTPTLRGPAAP